MAKSYLKITPELACRIKLIIADVDGTLLSDGEAVIPEVAQIMRALEKYHIMTGFDSGRPFSRLLPLAEQMQMTGPIIAENGCVAKLTRESGLFELGYTRKPAAATLSRFKADFPGAIRESPDIKDRLIDIGFFADGIPHSELAKRLEGVQLLDSGYMLHLIQNGVSKGMTLKRILKLIGNGQIGPRETIVFGDSATDASLFEEFENSVLVINPRLTPNQSEEVKNLAQFQSTRSFGEGFVEVASHILKLRQPQYLTDI
jgi:HAD superfamily hydrolase (TIGR01484 family)